MTSAVEEKQTTPEAGQEMIPINKKKNAMIFQ